MYLFSQPETLKDDRHNAHIKTVSFQCNDKPILRMADSADYTVVLLPEGQFILLWQFFILCLVHRDTLQVSSTRANKYTAYAHIHTQPEMCVDVCACSLPGLHSGS